MEQIKGLDTRKLRHRGLLMQQRTARVTPFPPKKKQRNTGTRNKRICPQSWCFWELIFLFFCWMLSWNEYILSWFGCNTQTFWWTAKYCWKICNFPLSTFMPPKKSPSPWPFDLSAAASCPGHFYPADDVAHVSATMKPKTCHSSFILLPKGKILIIMNLYFYWLV